MFLDLKCYNAVDREGIYLGSNSACVLTDLEFGVRKPNQSYDDTWGIAGAVVDGPF
jgi:hypothetical protein